MRKYSLRKVVAAAVILISLSLQSCEKEVFVEPRNDSGNIPNNRFSVISSPPGASVYIDGRISGFITPDTINWLPAGNHSITLKMENFLDTSFNVLIKENELSSVLIDYYRNPKMLGEIRCTSTPAGAKIYIDNQFTNRFTPSNFSGLIPRKYLVRYDLPEHRQDSSVVTVQSSKIKNLNITLEDTLDIITYPVYAYSLNCIGEDKKGNIWVGTTDGLSQYNGKKFVTYHQGDKDFMTSNIITDIKTDKDKNMWVGTSNSILKYDGTNWTIINSGMINQLFISPDNIVYAATNRGGILKLSGTGYESITTSSGLQYNGVTAVCTDAIGRIWVGPYYNGINIYDGISWQYYNTANGKTPLDNCSELAMDNNGNMYALFFKEYAPEQTPVETKLIKYSGGGWTIVRSAFDKNYDREIFFDSKNRLWIGLEGIIRISPDNKVENIYSIINQNLRLFNYEADKYNFLYAKKAFIDSKMNLWLIGGPYSVRKVKPGRWFY